MRNALPPLALCATLLCACSSVPDGVSVGSLPTKDGMARFVFIEGTEYPHLVTEIRNTSGLVLVECWRADPYTAFDHHWGMDEGEVRECFTYPAEVQNAAWSVRGFAQLRQNKNGTAVTNVGSNFNSTYQQNNPTWAKQGVVLREDRAAGVRWSVERKENRYVVRIYR